jgi:hypothetical protein
MKACELNFVFRNFQLKHVIKVKVICIRLYNVYMIVSLIFVALKKAFWSRKYKKLACSLLIMHLKLWKALPWA